MSPPAATKEDKPVAKKRKTSSSGGNGSPNPAGNNGSTGVNMHAELIKLEEMEARNRSPEEDSELFLDTTQAMKRNLADVFNLISKKDPSKASAAIAEDRIQTSLQVLTLKKLNRLDKLRTRSSREATNGAKQKVDSLHLKLQNLLYEVLHLNKEITKCQQFKSKDEEINLVPVQQFYREAPEEILKTEITQNNDHLQYLARLEFENQQRTEMNDSYKNFQSSQEIIEKIIREKKEKLSNLKPQLQIILEATRPVQEYLSMPLTEERDQLCLAKYLPMSLFILFSETRAFGEACDQNLAVKILGEIEEARSFHSRGQKDVEEDQDNDNAEEGAEEETSKKKRGAKGADDKKPLSKQEERLLKLLKIHPLTVEVQLAIPEAASSVLMTFSYLTRLKVIAVKVKLVLLGKEAKGLSTDQEILQAGNLLSHLFIPDGGLKSPNPTSKHFLNEIGLGSIPAAHVDNLGFFYSWAQNLGGMDFPNFADDNIDENMDEKVNLQEEICQTKVQEIISAIRFRVSARLSLQRQICQLEKAKLLSIELTVPGEAQAEFPVGGASSRIRNWTTVSWEDYMQVEITKHLVSGGLVDEHDFFYRLQINREPASLIALIAIKPDYPNRAPIFCLNLHWGKEFNLANSENIRSLEHLVNTGFQSLTASLRPELLTLQLQRLLTSLDVLLESWNALEEAGAKIDFKKEKMFLRTAKGRNRALPLIYNSKMKLFTHH